MIILESVLFHVCFVFLRYKSVNSSVMRSNICAIPGLPYMQYQNLLRFRWHSVQDGVTKRCYATLAEKAVITWHMNPSHQVSFVVTKMEDKKSLKLHWRSFAEWGSESVASYFAYECWRYNGWVNSWPNWIVITSLTWPKFVDALLMLHVQNGAVTVSLSFLPIKAADTLVMCIVDQIES